MDHKAIFNEIYSSNKWKNSSGEGSTEAATRQYRTYVGNFIRSNEIKTVVDIGCGDWQFSQLMNWDGIEYTGIDVSDVVLANTKRHARPGIEFLELDVTQSDPPPADLVLIKDVIQHWSNDDITSFLPKLRNFKSALITNGFHPNVLRLLNKNIPAGEYRAINLSRPPFSLNGCFAYWFQADEPKAVYLWRRDG